jgi:hypothetical protein
MLPLRIMEVEEPVEHVRIRRHSDELKVDQTNNFQSSLGGTVPSGTDSRESPRHKCDSCVTKPREQSITFGSEEVYSPTMKTVRASKDFDGSRVDHGEADS